MSGRSFDLLQEPWLPLRRPDGTMEEVSIRQAFRLAPHRTGIGGELPTTSVALLRLLVAVLQASLDLTLEGKSLWRDLWRGESLPCDEIDAYLDEYSSCFDLWHPERPFFQVADLTAVNGKVGSLLPLIADVPNNDQFFITRAGRGTAKIADAEAARWLVHCQAFDPSGIKTGAVGDPRVKGGRGYPIGVAWAGQTGVVVVEGATLKDTILLNMPLTRRTEEVWHKDDCPIWERAPRSSTASTEAMTGPKPLTLLTWPSRRVRLMPDGTGVTGVLICNGDRIEPQDQFGETMTAWRRSTNQEKALKRSLVYMPQLHRADRALWRGLSALLPLTSPAVADGAQVLEPLTLRWLGWIKSEGDSLDDDMPLRTRAVGVVYGSNNSVIEDIVDDALLVHAVLLGDRGEQLRLAALSAVAVAEEVARIVGQFAGNLEIAAGGDAAATRDQAREQLYTTLDRPYRRWLEALTADADPVDAGRRWQQLVDGVARDQERDLLSAAGPAAWVGRTSRQGGREQWFDAGLADRWFRTALRKALRMVYPPEQPNTGLSVVEGGMPS